MLNDKIFEGQASKMAFIKMAFIKMKKFLCGRPHEGNEKVRHGASDL